MFFKKLNKEVKDENAMEDLEDPGVETEFFVGKVRKKT